MKQLSLFLVLLLTLPAFAATLSDVLEVKQRTESGNTDLSGTERTVLQEFWKARLNTMQITDAAADIIAIRRDLEQPRGDEPLSFYSSAYIDAAKASIPSALDNISRMENTAKQELLLQNLMVLTAQLQSPALADIAIPFLDHKNEAIRYWVVKTLTNNGVIRMLTSEVTADEETKGTIFNALKQRLTFEKQIEIRTMIVNFAASVEHPVAREILLSMADERIQAYRTWSFMMEQESLDTRLLIALGSRAIMAQDNQDKSTLGRKFAELYALVLQAYMKGTGVLDEQQIGYLLTVILEVDRSVLDKMLNVSQTGIFRALQRQIGLEREYETIFGDRLRAGDLATNFGFDYGKDAAGRAITAPPEIGPIPESLKPTEP